VLEELMPPERVRVEPVRLSVVPPESVLPEPAVP